MSPFRWEKPCYVQWIWFWDFAVFSLYNVSFYLSFQNVNPDPTTHCGPYSPDEQPDVKTLHRKETLAHHNSDADKNCHDTIGMVVIDADANVAAGTTTNGACHKIPGYV